MDFLWFEDCVIASEIADLNLKRPILKFAQCEGANAAGSFDLTNFTIGWLMKIPHYTTK